MGRTGGKLALDELEESIKGSVGKDQTQVPFGPAQHGDVFAAEPECPFVKLDGATEMAAEEAAGALLRFGEYTTMVKGNPNGSVRLFDLHARNNSGSLTATASPLFFTLKTHKHFIHILSAL